MGCSIRSYVTAVQLETKAPALSKNNNRGNSRCGISTSLIATLVEPKLMKAAKVARIQAIQTDHAIALAFSY